MVSMHLATSGNNKILRTPPPHIRSSEEILLLAQIRTNKSPFLKSYLQKFDDKSHPSPLLHPHTRHTSFLQLLPWTTDSAGATELLARWTEKLACGPIARLKGVGRQ